MSRCDYDTIFYRVFCVSVLGIALAFTVILTNVFIDIDGLLSKRGDVASKPIREPVDYPNTYPTEDKINDVFYNDEPSETEDLTDPYRSKRSIDTENFLLHAKNPNVKKILTNKLATLLEELDEEESTKAKTVKDETNIEINDMTKDTIKKSENDNMLHLAMHNILLQGIIGHMDLNDVYKKVHTLVKSFYNLNTEVLGKPQKITIENVKDVPKEPLSKPYEENRFFEELLKCKPLQKQIAENNSRRKTNNQDPKLYIKTIIEINENKKLKKENNTNAKDIVGLIKLVYNGKSIKVENIEATDTEDSPLVIRHESSTPSPQVQIHSTSVLAQTEHLKPNMVTHPVWEKIIETYLNQHPLDEIPKKNFKVSRQKRQTQNLHKPKVPNKKDDEELYIEIETHFDGKGIKGEKKKKLVRNLIDKIQKAIHDEGALASNKKQILKHIKVKKRNQDPIKPNKDFFFKNIVPAIHNIEHRQVDPIGKILPPIDQILNSYGDTLWNQKYKGPSFLSVKSVNSAEKGEVSINYDTDNNEISKREQKPLNSESGAAMNAENVTFYVKDIEGSGFTIGFNQYMDAPPDAESLKLFNGLDNLINEYHKTYDDDELYKVKEEENYKRRDQKSIKNSHEITRRSVNTYSLQKYKYPQQKFIIPLKYNKDHIKRSKAINDFKKYSIFKNIYNIFPNNINVFSKPLKAEDLKIYFIENKYNSEGINHPDNIYRQKRSIKVKTISNLNSKIKLSRFINTKTQNTKKLFKKKRNKRQVNKIKIIARDKSQPDKPSNENVFLISPNTYITDRKPSLKEFAHETEVSDIPNEDSIPFAEFLNINYQNQPINEGDDRNETPSVLSMSKYPHILFEDYHRSKEYSNEAQAPIKPYRIQARTSTRRKAETITENSDNMYSNVKLPGVEEIVNAILRPKSNCKVTVKLSPKNTSDVHSGFKEVHTSVNKSFDRNGLRYFSLLNVSQISKIENLNESFKEQKYSMLRKQVPQPLPVNNEIKEREKQMTILFKLHKKRIDSQLENLKKERRFLENLLQNKNDLEKNVDIDNTYRNVKENDFINLLKAIETPQTTIFNKATDTTTLTQSTTEKPVQTTKKLYSIEECTEQNILINTIKKSENTTKEILKKIDMNTHLLRKFLDKISNHWLKTTPAPIKIEENSINWKVFSPNNQLFRQLPGFKNTSEIIPYIYSYPQHPPISYPGPSLKQDNINPYAVRNTVKEKTLSSPTETSLDKYQVKQNQSRFFFDDVDDYNSVISATIKINTTNV